MKIKPDFKKWLLATIVLALTGCAHARLEKGLEEKLAQEPDVKNPAALRTEAATILDNAPGLSGDQKNEIRALWSTTHEQLDAMNQRSLKLRVLLVEDLAAPESADREIDLIKKKLSHVEYDRLSLYFASVRQTNKILGRWGSSEDRYRFFEEMDFADHIQ